MWNEPMVAQSRQEFNDAALARVKALDLEQVAWDLLTRTLRDHPEVAAIARVLCGVERRASGLPSCELFYLPVKEARRFVTMAEDALARLDEEREGDAVEAVAHILAEGPEGEYSPFGTVPQSVQTHYRRWAQHAINAYFAALGRRS